MKRLLVRLVILGVLAAGLYFSLASLSYRWDFGVVWTYRALFIQGFYNTLLVSLLAISLGLVLGLGSGLARVSGNIWLCELCGIYVLVFRGTPLLVQIYIFYFCLAVVAHYDNALVIGAVSLGFFSGAYVCEMVRAGVESLEAGQWEAGLGSGMTHHQTLRFVIFPQALRRIIPPLTGQFVSLVKDSSLLSVIAVRELTKGAEMVNAATYRTFEAYLPLALFYLVLTYPLSLLTSRLEKRITSPNKTPNL